MAKKPSREDKRPKTPTDRAKKNAQEEARQMADRENGSENPRWWENQNGPGETQ